MDSSIRDLKIKERTVRLSEDDDKLLLALAKKKRVAPAVLMRMWVTQALEATITSAEHMGHIGVTGRS